MPDKLQTLRAQHSASQSRYPTNASVTAKAFFVTDINQRRASPMAYVAANSTDATSTTLAPAGAL